MRVYELGPSDNRVPLENTKMLTITKLRTYACALLAMSMTIPLVACGGGDKDDNGGDGTGGSSGTGGTGGKGGTGGSGGKCVDDPVG